MPREESEKNQVSDRTPEPIAIVGVGLRFPGGSNSLDEFDAFLREGRSGIGPIPGDRWDVEAFTPQSPDDKGKIHTTSGGFLDRIDRFDAAFFNISPKEAQYMDPQQRMLLETAWQALEHANIDPAPLRRGNGGVYIGASSIDYALELDSLPYEELDGLLASGITMFPLSGRLSYFLGWRGPSMSVDTACSSSLAALHVAVQGLRAGETDIALCGGVNALHHPRIPVMFSNAQMLSPDGQCKTFDESADGYARAEGCGILVLKRLSDATRDGDTVLALVRGTAVGQDGDSAGLTVPNGPAQEKVIRSALAAAALAPEDIQYVEAHGTGTPLGDPIEFGAIGDTFADSHTKSDPLLVGSVKTNLGHMEPASGIVGVIKAVLQIRSATIYPHLNLDTPSGRIPWDLYPVRVPTACEPWKAPVRRAVVNSFGFAGTIGAVVLEQPPAAEERETATGEAPATPMFTLSAKTAAALREQVANYRRLLDEDPDLPVDALCYTGNVSRTHHPYRVAGPVTDRAALTKLLDKAADHDHQGPAGIRKVAFMFSGQGSQYAGMGAHLYERFPVFRRHVDECDRLFAEHLGRSIRDLVLGTADDPEAIDRTEYTQPALFTLEYALAQLWMAWGVRPNVLIGHSIGEVSAAAVAGLFSLPDAVTLVAARARLMQAVRAEGGMAAIGAPAEDVLPLLEPHPDLALAASNAPDQCVISGGAEALAQVTEELRAQGLRVDQLAVSHAFHSPLMAEVYDDFRAALDGLTFREPSISLISNVTGKLARFAEIGTPDYWVRHIGEPVQFLSGIRAVARRGRHALVEIGPSTALTALAQRSLPVADHLWLASLRRRDRGGDTTLRALAEYYTAGLPVSWSGYHEDRIVPAKTALPTYAFQRKRYWLPTATPRKGGARGGVAHHPMLGTESQPVGDVREFTAEFTAEELGALADFADGDRTTLPASAYVDLLLALQDAVHGHTRTALQELRLREPLTLTADTPCTLTTRLRPRADGGADVTVLSVPEKAADGEDGTELVHATAVFAAGTGQTQDDPVLAGLGLGPVVLESDAEDLYTDLASVGRPHGPRARALVSAARHQDGCHSAELSCRGTTAVEQMPAELIEAAVAAAIALDPEGPVFLAREIASVRHFKKPRAERLTVVARVATERDRRLADILVLEDGNPVLELGGVTLARPEVPSGRRQFLHRPEWVRRALPALASGTAPRHLLLLGRTDSAPTADGGPRVTPVADSAALKAALEDTSVTDVCWSWRQLPGAMSAELMRAECEHNYRDLLGLLTVLDAAAQQRPPRLWLVTEGAQRLPGDGAGTGAHLGAATLWGFGRVLLTESPQYRATLVDIEPGGDLSALLDEVRAEAPGEYQVALRAGRRHVRRLLPGDAARTWPGGFALRTPDSGDLSDLALAPADDRAPAAGEVQVRVASVALTAADARAALDGEQPAGAGPVLGSLAAGTVLAAGAEAAFTAGDEVYVRHDGALCATLTVPATEVALAPGAASGRAGGKGRGGATAFRLEEIGEALRTAASGAREVWVDVPGGPEAEPAPARVRPDRTYLVTGGLGGLGLVTARKLVSLGARHLTLVSRGGRATEEAAPVLAELSERAEVTVIRADVSSADDVRRLAAGLAAGPHPVGGVVHAAGSFDKKLIAELTWESIDAQLAPKAYGGWLLHEAAEEFFPDLDFFVTYSSIASVLGGATQGHYAAASAGLDGLAEWRGLRGLPGLSVNWGAWARVGMSARLDEQLAQEIDRSGVRFFSPTRALDTLARLWQRPGSRRVVGEFDWARYVAGGGVDDAFYDRLARHDQGGADGTGLDLAALTALPKPERTALIAAAVREKVADALHMDAEDDLDPNAEFVSLGLDSLMAQTVKGGLETLFRLPLPASLTFDHPTVRRLTEFLDGRLAPATQQHP
ncbi:SDR family oxidoreductase [Streptomyces sp. BG9H]|uniref:SDR family oxidoreductase n=1 Tax=Streptomyces anatolicus TaxID=2675858 RepID=A0ABS6YF03_9ACTN|nr:type I polyketide synthase [Streptomyces anatolicus]MBW5419991.1 SDR family oxidoreductase [Streptomyces anatolicus]